MGDNWYLVVSGGSDISTEVETARGVQEDNREGLVEVSQGWLGEGERQALMVNPSSGPKLGKAAWRRKQLPCLKFLDHHSQDL